MNNYTVVIQTQQAGMTADQVKAAVEDTLLRALPPVTLHFGGAAQPDDHTVLVAVASDGKRDFLASRLRGLENHLPVRLERIEWGYPVAAQEKAAPSGAAEGMQRFPTQHFLRVDPYAEVLSQPEPSRTYRPSTWSNLRGTLSTIFLLSWVVFLVLYLAIIGRNWPTLLDNRAAVWAMQIWLFLSLFSGPPYLPWHMITAVTCDPEGIEVHFLFKRKPKRRAWSEIYGINVNLMELTLLSRQEPVRFSAKQRTGFREEPMLIKTIITRASLRFAGASLAHFSYRRADAPD